MGGIVSNRFKKCFLFLKETFLLKNIVELGGEEIIKYKLRVVGLNEVKKIEKSVKSIRYKNIISSSKFEIKLLIKDYKYK